MRKFRIFCLSLAAISLCGISTSALAAKKSPKSPPMPEVQAEVVAKSLLELNEYLAKALHDDKEQDFREELQLSSNTTTMTIEELAKDAERRPPPVEQVEQNSESDF